MLPLRGRFEAASKSNSSTFCPSRTTTLVSSGWLASISIRLGIGVSVRPGRARANAAQGAERAQEGWGALCLAPEQCRRPEGLEIGRKCSGGISHKSNHLGYRPQPAGNLANVLRFGLRAAWWPGNRRPVAVDVAEILR